MNYAAPTHVTGRIHAETLPGKVPLAFSGALSFANGANASFYCSFNAANAQWAIVSGDKALVRVADFVLPFSGSQTQFTYTRSEFVIDGCQFDMHAGKQISSLHEPSSNAPGSQESAMFQTFSKLVLSGQIDAQWPKISLLTQRVLDACLKSAHDGSRVVEMGA